MWYRPIPWSAKNKVWARDNNIDLTKKNPERWPWFTLIQCRLTMAMKCIFLHAFRNSYRAFFVFVLLFLFLSEALIVFYPFLLTLSKPRLIDQVAISFKLSINLTWLADQPCIWITRQNWLQTRVSTGFLFLLRSLKIRLIHMLSSNARILLTGKLFASIKICLLIQ